MLFLLPADGSVKAFWMKGVSFPLDILFFDAREVLLGWYPSAQPFSLQSLPVPATTTIALEVAGGWAMRYRLNAGQRAVFANIPLMAGGG